MQVMGFFVWVRVPDHKSSAEVSKEIKTSIGFGQAQVSDTMFVFREEPEPQKEEYHTPPSDSPTSYRNIPW